MKTKTKIYHSLAVVAEYNRIAASYEAKGEYGKAIECYEKALYTAYRELGFAYHYKGYSGKAREFHNKASKIRRNKPIEAYEIRER